MKKVFALAVVTMLTVTFNACTDSDLEKLPNETETKQATNPGDDGKIKTKDPQDDGEG